MTQFPRLPEAVAAEFGTKAIANLNELAEQVSAVTIAVPTEHHFKAAEPFLKRGIACFDRKNRWPRNSAEGNRLSNWPGGITRSSRLATSRRFNPAVVALARLNLSPRFIDAVRLSPLPFAVWMWAFVLDVMIHDIDIVLSLVKSPVRRVEAVGAKVIATSRCLQCR